MKLAALTLLYFGFELIATSHQLTLNGGVSTQVRQQGSDGSYRFGYDITDHQGATNFRKETGIRGEKSLDVIGSYGIQDVDGRMRLVDYKADKDGFRAKIRSNEPGMMKDSNYAVYNGIDDSGYRKWQ